MKRAFLRTVLAMAGACGVAGPAGAAGPTVVELFTSQSCYSCPPAEMLLGELSARRDVVALEYHVDYWDDLVYGSAGRWKDPFSQRAFTDRQRAYNQAIRNKTAVYTPQMVIDGRLEAVGSDRGAVAAALARAGAQSGRVEVSVAVRDGGGAATLAGAGREAATVWLVRYRRSETTRVAAGENKGKTLKNHNIVTGIERVGEWRGSPVSIAIPGLALGPDEGCAILVQDDRPGPVLGAGLCRGPGS
jgi:hypothetical protein